MIRRPLRQVTTKSKEIGVAFHDIRYVLEALRPPSKHEEETEEDKRVRAWRWSVVVSILLIIVIGSLHLGSVSGAFESVGIHGLANTAEVKQNKEIGLAILRRLFSEDVRRKVRERCRADNDEDREKANIDLQNLLRQFELEAGEEYGDLPGCEDV